MVDFASYKMLLNRLIVCSHTNILNKKKYPKSSLNKNDKYRVAGIITEYHIISKLIFLSINIPKLMIIRQ